MKSRLSHEIKYEKRGVVPLILEWLLYISHIYCLRVQDSALSGVAPVVNWRSRRSDTGLPAPKLSITEAGLQL